MTVPDQGDDARAPQAFAISFSAPDARPKPSGRPITKQPFLRKGEGTARRLDPQKPRMPYRVIENADNSPPSSPATHSPRNPGTRPTRPNPGRAPAPPRPSPPTHATPTHAPASDGSPRGAQPGPGRSPPTVASTAASYFATAPRGSPLASAAGLAASASDIGVADGARRGAGSHPARVAAGGTGGAAGADASVGGTLGDVDADEMDSSLARGSPSKEAWPRRKQRVIARHHLRREEEELEMEEFAALERQVFKELGLPKDAIDIPTDTHPTMTSAWPGPASHMPGGHGAESRAAGASQGGVGGARRAGVAVGIDESVEGSMDWSFGTKTGSGAQEGAMRASHGDGEGVGAGEGSARHGEVNADVRERGSGVEGGWDAEGGSMGGGVRGEQGEGEEEGEGRWGWVGDKRASTHVNPLFQQRSGDVDLSSRVGGSGDKWGSVGAAEGAKVRRQWGAGSFGPVAATATPAQSEGRDGALRDASVEGSASLSTLWGKDGAPGSSVMLARHPLDGGMEGDGEMGVGGDADELGLGGAQWMDAASGHAGVGRAGVVAPSLVYSRGTASPGRIADAPEWARRLMGGRDSASPRRSAQPSSVRVSRDAAPGSNGIESHRGSDPHEQHPMPSHVAHESLGSHHPARRSLAPPSPARPNVPPTSNPTNVSNPTNPSNPTSAYDPYLDGSYAERFERSRSRGRAGSHGGTRLTSGADSGASSRGVSQERGRRVGRDPSPAPSDSASLGAQSTRSRADALRRLRQVTHARKRGPEMRGGDGGGGAVAGGGGAVGVGMGGEVQGDPWARYLGSQDQTGEEENAGNRERGAVVGTGGAEGWGEGRGGGGEGDEEVWGDEGGDGPPNAALRAARAAGVSDSDGSDAGVADASVAPEGTEGESLVVTNRFVRTLFESARRQQPGGRRGRGGRGEGRAGAGRGGRGEGRGSGAGQDGAADRTKGVESNVDNEEYRLALEKVHGELQRLREERGRVQALRQEVERERARLARDRETLEEERASQAETLRARWEEESRKLQRDRRVLEKQTKALLSLPGKKERQELEEMEMRLGGMKEEMQAREAKHRLTCDRLRKQIAEQAEVIAELREEVRWHEKRALERWDEAGAQREGKGSRGVERGQGRGGRERERGAGGPERGAGGRGGEPGSVGPRKDMQGRGMGGGGVGMGGGSMGGGGGIGGVVGGASGVASAKAVYEGALREAEERSRALSRGKARPGVAGTVSGVLGGMAGTGDGSHEVGAAGRAVRGATVRGAVGAEGDRESDGEVNGAGAAVGANGRGSMAAGATRQAEKAGGGARGAWRMDLRDVEDGEGVASDGESERGEGLGGKGGVRGNRGGGGTVSTPTAVRWASEGDDWDDWDGERGGAVGVAGRTGAAAGGERMRSAAGGAQSHSHLLDAVAQKVAGTDKAGGVGGVLGAGHACAEGPWDGDKRVTHMPGGGKVVVFRNGTRKESRADGRSIVWFANGDVKKVDPKAGQEEYYYAEVDTWHTTCANGTEVFHFASGQTEAHHPSGIKEVVFPDGAARVVMPGGVEKEAPRSALCREILRPRPRPEL